MHKNSHEKMEWFKNTYLNIANKLDILDVGSLDSKGNYNYSDIFNEKNWNYTGLDFEAGNNVNIVVSNIYNWPEVENNKYDVVISGQFFEHLKYFWLTMSQIERVLKPGGYLCIIVPSAGPRHGGDMPNCYIYHEDGLKAMAQYVNLEVMHVSIDKREEAAPWQDACLVAHKKNIISKEDKKDLETKMNELENKLDSILETVNNK